MPWERVITMLFFRFLFQYRFTTAAFLLFAAVFAGVFYLYGAPAEAVLYAGVLCAGAVLAAAVPRFLKFRKRHLLMQDIYANLPLKTENLPPPENPAEEDLNRMVVRLSALCRENAARFSAARRESVDYYTVWLHQIKTPIAAMRMILQSEDTETGRALSAELFSIEQYADMALNYLRLDSPSSDFVIRRYDLGGIVRKAVHRYAPLMIRRKIRLEYADPHAQVLTDEKWLLFIIEQLLSNAVKYTAKGTVKIDFEEGILRISDTGIGIASEDLPRIFEKGFTGLGGRTDGKSTGLGLYLCKRAADKLGHALCVSSRAGEGTMFTIDLRSEELELD